MTSKSNAGRRAKHFVRPAPVSTGRRHKPADKSKPAVPKPSGNNLSESLVRAAAGAYRSGAVLACKHGNHGAARVYSRFGEKIERLALEAARAGL